MDAALHISFIREGGGRGEEKIVAQFGAFL